MTGNIDTVVRCVVHVVRRRVSGNAEEVDSNSHVRLGLSRSWKDGGWLWI
jgi:hypothetical protein